MSQSIGHALEKLIQGLLDVIPAELIQGVHVWDEVPFIPPRAWRRWGEGVNLAFQAGASFN